MAPVQAFAKAFNKFGINPTFEEIRKPMGMLKWDHVHTMLKMSRIAEEWKRVHVGSTTGYTDEMMTVITVEAAKKGYTPDAWFSPNSVGDKGRPYPFMIFKNLEALEVTSVNAAIKVGDTVSDIKEGKNAGLISVGVTEGSSVMGLSEEEFNALSQEEKDEANKKAATVFSHCGLCHK